MFPRISAAVILQAVKLMYLLEFSDVFRRGRGRTPLFFRTPPDNEKAFDKKFKTSILG